MRLTTTHSNLTGLMICYTRTITPLIVKNCPQINPPFFALFCPLFAMTKVTTIQSQFPSVDVKLWERGKRYFWAYNYDGCNKNGPFKSEKLALADAQRLTEGN